MAYGEINPLSTLSLRSAATFAAALFLAVLCGCASPAARALHDVPRPAALHVLFVGNSLTYYNNLPALVAAVYRSAVPHGEIETEMLAQGGLLIREHLKAGFLQQILNARHFDVVVLQERGGLPYCSQSEDCDNCSFYKQCLDSPVAIREAIALVQSKGARAVLYGTWSGIPELQIPLSDALRKIAMETGAAFADVGAAMHQFAYHENMPVMWDATAHPTETGSWLAAMMLVRAITAAPLPDTVPPETCAPDWSHQRPQGNALASTQPQPEPRCFAISEHNFEQLRLAVLR